MTTIKVRPNTSSPFVTLGVAPTMAYTTDLGAVTAATPITVTHNLGTFDVAVQIVEKGTAGAGAAVGTLVDATVELTSVNALTVTFTSSAAANLYRVTVLAVGGSAVPTLKEYTQNVDNSLTSLAAMTTGSGTWTVNTYAQCAVATSTACRALSTTTVSAGDVQIVECEVEIPSGFTSNNQHLGIGFQSADAAGAIMGAIRGDGNAYIEQDATVALTTVAYAIPAAGSWVKLRWKWNTLNNSWLLYIDGTLKASYTTAQTFTPSLKPYVKAYSSGAMTVRYRNLKQWSLTDYTMPADPV